MKKISSLINFQFLALCLIVSCILLIPTLIHAGTYYNCIDKQGNASFSDYPVEDQICTGIQTNDEVTSAKKENKKSNKEVTNFNSSDDKTTKVTIIANKVLVPVTLVYDSNETNVNLVLDTGASGTLIHENVADQLYINLSKGQNAKGRVAGGGVLEGKVITLSSLKIGPYTFYKRNIFVVPYEGPASNYDGLLGMDLLREMNYKLDLGKQAIIWN